MKGEINSRIVAQIPILFAVSVSEIRGKKGGGRMYSIHLLMMFMVSITIKDSNLKLN